MLQKIQLRPGINREGTNYSNEGGYYDGDKIRFRSGYPEKIGGWGQISANTFLGLCRSLWNWVDLSSNNYIGLGTNIKYYIFQGGTYSDVTPYVKTNVLINPFQTSYPATPTKVTVTDAGYSPSVGDYVVFSNASAVGGITIDGEYVVVTVPTGSTYTITSAIAATSSASGGGTVTANYEYPIGGSIFTVGTGWGAGPWSRSTWGSGYSSGVGIQLRLWTNDNYGQDLVIAPRGGGIYYWQAANGVGVRAQALSTLSTTAGYSGTYVPTTTNEILASSTQQFIIAFGANSYVSGNPSTAFNPMLVRWSDQANAYQWVPSITNQSGEFTLSHGSFIMQTINTRQEILIWTDSTLYSMQYLGPPYVWGFNILMDNISIMSPNAAITVNNITYWMGTDKFYMYSGRVETLPCSLRQYVFADINLDQGYQVFCGGNAGYNEVWWFYVSSDSTGNTIDKYVVYNYLDRVWYYGTMARTAWLDSSLIQYPIAADYNGRLLNHEYGVDDNATSTTIAIEAYVQSSDFDIGDGHNFGFVWRILPDVNFNGSNVNAPAVTMSVKPRQNSGTAYGIADSPAVTSGDDFSTRHTYNIQEFTGQVYTRLRGRQMAFKIASTGLGVAWQLGSPRIDIRPDGRR